MAGAMLGAMSGAVLAIPIFEDDFNRSNSNTVGNGWAEIEDDRNDVRVQNNRLLLRDDAPRTGVRSRVFDLSGYSSVSLSYDWRAGRGQQRNDRLAVQWRDLNGGTGWETLVSHRLTTTGYTPETFSFAGGSDRVRIRFRLRVDESDEWARIDNVRLTGNSVAAVPEPTTLLLFGIGLVGLGGGLYRRGVVSNS